MTMQEIPQSRKLLNGVEWHPEHDSVLREHWGKLSTSQIGVRIGRTKGAVIGRAHRLGLERLRTANPWTADATAMVRRLWVAKVSADEIARQVTEAFGVRRTAATIHHRIERKFGRRERIKVPHFKPAPPSRADKIAAEDARIPLKQRRTLFELTCHTCRWPVGDPDKPDFFFCGAELLEGRSYCEFHHSVAHYSVRAPRPNFVFLKRKSKWSTKRALHLLQNVEDAA